MADRSTKTVMDVILVAKNPQVDVSKDRKPAVSSQAERKNRQVEWHYSLM
jgi:hypothetical protein